MEIDWKLFRITVWHSFGNSDLNIKVHPFVVNSWADGVVSVGDCTGKELFLLHPELPYPIIRLDEGLESDQLIQDAANFILERIRSATHAPVYYWKELLSGAN